MTTNDQNADAATGASHQPGGPCKPSELYVSDGTGIASDREHPSRNDDADRGDSDLTRVCEYVRRRAERGGRRRTYRIPVLWNCWGYGDARPTARGEVAVEPYRFLLACLDRVILPARSGRRLAWRSLSSVEFGPGTENPDGNRRRAVHESCAPACQGPRLLRRGGDWIRAANIYGMLIRTTTAWDHDGDGSLRPTGAWTETGTFLKSILLLPHLLRMGVDTIYLLPIAEVSRTFRRGEAGCPYSVKSFFRLEGDLHDRLLDDSGLDVEAEFSAFVEAAHAVGMRVMIDFSPRTVSRDSDLILDHPDWLYWIDAATAAKYEPPRVEGYGAGIPEVSQLGDIFGQAALQRHLARFRPAPNVAAPGRWAQFAERCRAEPLRDLLGEIARRFGVITPPGFSDVMNDPQPSWTDVTFLRLYLDHPAASTPHLHAPARQPPYVFTDTIKASKFPGRRPNLPLWRMLADVLPFYQRFGVDGARVDMGHALPAKLQRMIVGGPRRRDPDFCFLAEELNPQAAPTVRRAGYNAIVGSSWYMEPRHADGQLHRFVREVLPSLSLPVLATAETPDSPRAAVRPGKRAFARLVGVLNNFLPSAVPFVNSGFELFERQQMNFGLDVAPSRRFMLPKTDPFCGKLAFFDHVILHWCNAGAATMVGRLGLAAALRRRFIADLARPRNGFVLTVAPPDADRVLAVGWRVEGGRRVLVVAANLDFRRARCSVLDAPALKRRPDAPADVLLRVGPPAEQPMLARGHLRVVMPRGGLSALLV